MADELSTHYINYKLDIFFSEAKFCWLERDHMRIVPVRNQQRCCACCAFTIADCVSSLYYALKRQLRILSTQQCVDCAHHRQHTEADKNGCKPSTLNKTLLYVRDTGLHLDRHYPYVGKKGDCYASKIPEAKVKIKHFHDIKADETEDEINFRIEYQPIAAVIELFESFRSHRGGGTYMGKQAGEESIGKHALLIVGYGVDKNGVKYYLVKNSWGKEWGYHGYARVRRELLFDLVYPVSPDLEYETMHEPQIITKSKKQVKSTRPRRRN